MSNACLTYARNAISSRAARQAVEAAVDYAERKGWRVAACVVDLGGHILSLTRMDGAAPTIGDFAADKAYTAAMAGKSTRAFFERMAGSPELALGLANRPRLLCWEGGLPIMLDGQLVGGMGVSGATGPEDAECAAAALQAIGFTFGETP